MRAMIGGQTYELSPAFGTLLKYRAETGRSFLSEGWSLEKLTRLAYLAITGPRPYYHRFEDDCRRDPYYIATARHFFEEVTHNPEPPRGGEVRADAKICEYELLALYTKNGLPPHLLDVLPVFGILAAINACCDITVFQEDVTIGSNTALETRHTAFGDREAMNGNNGNPGINQTAIGSARGGEGGSGTSGGGGGGGSISPSTAYGGSGGSDGASGSVGGVGSQLGGGSSGGTGSGETSKAFGGDIAPFSGEDYLFSGGGGGGRGGGGGTGGGAYASTNTNVSGNPGFSNTGGGGSGATGYYNRTASRCEGGDGGSGIVIIRWGNW